MKIFIASDLHGSAEYCRQMIEAFTKENADKLLMLGDILYHGPRNPLPEGYSPQEVLSLLDTVKDSVICVSGNCDAEIDRALLPFPVLPDFGAIFADGLNIYFAHGHRDAPALSEGDVYITGHTHVPLNNVENGYFHLNPGSLSLPKEDSGHGYIIYENRKFVFKRLNGEAYDELDTDKKEEPAVEQTAVTERAPAVKRPQVVRRKLVIRRR